MKIVLFWKNEEFMRDLEILFETSPWFILLCLLAGAAYSFLLYQKGGPWSRTVNWLLAGVRFTLVSLACLLLLGPFVKQLRNIIEDPTVVIAVDNSLSVAEGADSAAIRQSLARLEDIRQRLAEQNFNAVFYTFGGRQSTPVSETVFNHRSTDLDELLTDIQTAYESKKLAGVALLSDGIYNIGVSPTYKTYNFNVFTVGIGDTVPKADINLRALYYNKIAYQGNKFPLVAEVSSHGFVNENIALTIYRENEEIASKNIALEGNSQIQQVEFLIDATEEGMQHYVVRIPGKEAEFTLNNNERHAYVDVIEGKEKILCVAPSPHPDVKALRSALEDNKNYEFTLYIPGLTNNEQDVLSATDQTYDMVIFHQSPDIGERTQQAFNHFSNLKTPAWYIVGPQTHLNRLQSQTDIVNLTAVGNQKDRVTPVFNRAFTHFQIAGDIEDALNVYPPLTIPFGKWELSPAAETLLYQKIGAVKTEKPLLVVSRNEEQKSAILLGDGLWRWRQQEYATRESYEIFDQLAVKLTQFLSAKEDRRKFRVYPIKDEFFDTESVVFETETYNDIYERIYGQQVELSVTDEEGEKRDYVYTTNANNTQYRIGDLAQGVYKYTAQTSLNGERVESSGEFTVRELQVESVNLTANFDLLRELSEKTNGKFYTADQLNLLEDDLTTREARGVIYSSEEFLPIINMDWLFFLLLALVSIEWFTRKYNSGY